jgi:hypothetical protein
VLALLVASPLATATPVSANPGLVVSDMNVGGVTATDMANALVGSGVTVSGAAFTGNKRAGGKFSGGAPSVGFDNGIILDSGKVQTYSTDPACSRGVEGPNTCYEQWTFPFPGGGPGPNGPYNSTAFGTAGDADLDALSGFTTFDAAILEFDFIPQGPTVQFQYVFSSEEYSDFSNTTFNDVFGFFINKTNCATVPVTGQPVSINTINNGNDAGLGSTTPQNPLLFRDNVRPKPSLDTQMDGLTTILTCNATVMAGQKNHMKLAIADASDRILDSAVFLKGGSLISGTQVSTSLKGGGQSGPIITVPQGTSVTDSATLTGLNTATASGTVTYTVYSDSMCTAFVASAGTVTVTNGMVPDSSAVTMSTAGTFYWQAKYSGDTFNNGSSSPCGSEVVTVIVVEPQIKAQAVGISATEGQAFVGTVATFTDGDMNATAGEYSATINWGDGPLIDAGTVSGGFPTDPGNFTVTGKHIYAEEGSYHVTVVITDIDTPSNNATVLSSAKVADASLSSTCTMPPFITPAFTGSTASFSDTSSTGTLSDFSATINWGDSSTSTGTIVGGPGLVAYDVSGSHTYTTTGNFTVTTTINDVGGSFTVATCKVLVAVFATANGGTFVVGDLEATGPMAPLTWWGSQWAKINQMSGGPAPNSMKGFSGFEDMPLPSPLPPLSKICGMTWTTDTGNSTPPPPSVPDDMLVIVSTHIVQNGSVISGDIKQLILVHNNPGYQPDPGSPGTGTETIIVCTAP